jgi:hypothetical protein
MCTHDDLKPLRDKLIRDCEGYDADEAVRAMASALVTIIVGATSDRTEADLALDRLFAALRENVARLARPPGARTQ